MGLGQERERLRQRLVISARSQIRQRRIRTNEVRSLQNRKEPPIVGIQCAGASGAATGNLQCRGQVHIGQLPQYPQCDVEHVVTRTAAIGKTELADPKIRGIEL